MTFTELWLTYHQISRCDKPATAQLVELEFQNQKLVDLEDVMEHLFRQGFIEAKHRSMSWWEKKDGEKIHGSIVVEELLKLGFGRCAETAIKLIIADSPPVVWFSYVYRRNTTGSVVTQRIKLDTPGTRFERIAHLTNYIFKQGFLPAHERSLVYWEGACGKKIEEQTSLQELLTTGDGLIEATPLRLVIDHASCHIPHHVPHHHPVCRCP